MPWLFSHIKFLSFFLCIIFKIIFTKKKSSNETNEKRKNWPLLIGFSFFFHSSWIELFPPWHTTVLFPCITVVWMSEERDDYLPSSLSVSSFSSPSSHSFHHLPWDISWLEWVHAFPFHSLENLSYDQSLLYSHGRSISICVSIHSLSQSPFPSPPPSSKWSTIYRLKRMKRKEKRRELINPLISLFAKRKATIKSLHYFFTNSFIIPINK